MARKPLTKKQIPGGKNILLVSFDDCVAYHHYRNVFGQTLLTPNLDRITSQAAHFQSAYCQSPICGPSRASFMSARTPHQLGIQNLSVDIFDRVAPTDIWSCKLKENGYFCSSGGKVHHGYGPLKKKYHDVIYSDEQKRFGSDFSLPPHVEKRRDGGISGGWSTMNEKDDDIFYDAKSANSAIDFLQNYDRDEPFYREVGFFSPHGPRFTPVRFKDMYDHKKFNMPKEWSDGFDDHPYTDEHMLQTPEMQAGNVDWWQRNVRNYFSALSHGDYHLGRVWDALQASRFADNTVVVILTDHGFLLGGRNRFYKSTIWEQSAAVPLIIYDPDNPQQRIIEDPVALIDVGPTVLDYANVDPLTDTVGRTLRPQMEGGPDPDRAIPTFRYDNVSIRKGDYRFARYMDGSTQLYDITTDIWNHNNLGSDHPAYAPMQDALIECSEAYGLENKPVKKPQPTAQRATKEKEKPMGEAKQPLGVVGMVFEDYLMLQRWYDYYAGQVGPENLFIFSHGNDPRHREIAVGANVINLPRDPSMYKFDILRWRMLGNFASGMLNFYDWMLVTDIDEMVLVDPAVAPGLVPYLQDKFADEPAPTNLSPLGLNIVHVPEEEPLPIVEGETILSRRRYFYPSRTYSKATLVRAPVMFAPGGHRNNLGPRTLSDDLYLIHLKMCDMTDLIQHSERQVELLDHAGQKNKGNNTKHGWRGAIDVYQNVRNTFSLGPEDITLTDIRTKMVHGQKPKYTDRYIWGDFKNSILYQIPSRFSALL